MPQIGAKCPGINEYHTFESGDCLFTCDHQCLPASVLYHIQQGVRADKHVGAYFSVTSLLGCLRQLYFERTIDYYVEPPKSWWSMRGRLIHALLENPDFETRVADLLKYINNATKETPEERARLITMFQPILDKLYEFAKEVPDVHIPNWEAETEYQWETGLMVCQECGHIWKPFLATDGLECPQCYSVNTVQILFVGTIDVLRPHTGELIDYKTIGDKGLGIIKDGAKKDHIMQFNMYRFLVERGHPRHMKKEDYKPITVKSIKAVYMTMMDVVQTGTLFSQDTIFQKSVPAIHPNEKNRVWLAQRDDMVLKKGKRHATAKPEDFEFSHKDKWRIYYQVPEVELMPLDDIQKFVLDTIPILARAFHGGVIPNMCPPEMRAWKCDSYCPDQIREACDAHNAVTGEVRVVAPVANEIEYEQAA